MATPEPDIPRLPEPAIPVLPGFKVRRLNSGGYRAVALYEITHEMAEFGCRGVITATSLGELEMLCCAERIKRDLVRAAVRLAQDVRPWRDG